MADEEAERSERELELQESLQNAGVAILYENPAFKHGNTTRYKILCKNFNRGSSDFEVLGEDREHALRAALVMLKAT